MAVRKRNVQIKFYVTEKEKHEIRCSEIEKRLGKYCFFKSPIKIFAPRKEGHRRGGLLFSFQQDSNPAHAAVRWTAAKRHQAFAPLSNQILSLGSKKEGQMSKNGCRFPSEKANRHLKTGN